MISDSFCRSGIWEWLGGSSLGFLTIAGQILVQALSSEGLIETEGSAAKMVHSKLAGSSVPLPVPIHRTSWVSSQHSGWLRQEQGMEGARKKVLCPLWSSLQGYPLPLPQYLLVTTVSQANIKGMMGGDDRKHKYQKPRISECHLGDWLPQQLPFSVNRNHNHTSIYFFLSNYYVQGPVQTTSHSSLNPDSNPKI